MDRSELSIPSAEELRAMLLLKHGSLDRVGWAVKKRLRWGYYLPDRWYEAMLDRCVGSQTRWLDVGGGKTVLPHNPPLAERLAQRCALLVGVDPSDNIHQNPLVRERAQCLIEDYQTHHVFDLITLRMVVEHVTDPQKVMRALARLTTPGGRVVVFTVSRWAPISLASQVVPFQLHHGIKRLIWGVGIKEEDSFPVVYRMNTGRRLRGLFEAHGFRERLLLRLEDLVVFTRVSRLYTLELALWRAWRAAGLTYPEHCLLGVYERTDRP